MKKMWKRFVSLLLACTLLAGMLPLSASAVSEPTDSQWITEKIEEINAGLEQGEQYHRGNYYKLGDSDLYRLTFTRTIDTETATITDAVIFIVPGTDANENNSSIPDYNSLGETPWEESSASAVYIADGVTGIGNHAFDGMSTLETLEIQNPGSLTRIGEHAFNGCDKLVGPLNLSGVTEMGEYAFNGCERLGSGEDNEGVKLSDNLTKIPENAFSSCGLKNVNIPTRCTEIGNNAFANNSLSQIAALVLPEGLTTIGDNAFSLTMGEGDTSSGITSLTIPSTVTSIGVDAFSGRRNLQTVTVKDDKKADTKLNLGDGAFGFNEFTAYSKQGSITDENEITYNGLLGTTFYLPADLVTTFKNGENCFTGDISPMKYVNTVEPTCTTDGYHIYKTTISGAMTDDGKPVEVTYHDPLPMLGHDYQFSKKIPATCETDSYDLYVCSHDSSHTENRNVGNESGPKGHNYLLTDVENLDMGDGSATTFTWTCQKQEHDDSRDTRKKEVKISINPTAVQADTTMTYGKLVMPTVVGGTLTLAENVDENAPLTTDVTSVKVVFTPDNVKYAGYTGMGAVSGFGGVELTLKVDVNKAELDFSDVNFGNTRVFVDSTASEGTPITVYRGSLPEDVTYGTPLYSNDTGYNENTPPPRNSTWSGTVSVTFTYDPDKYEVDAEKKPGVDYTFDAGTPGQVTITHSYVIVEQSMDDLAAAPISPLTYKANTPQDTVHLSGVPYSSTVSWKWEEVGNQSNNGQGTETSPSDRNAMDIAPITDAGTYRVTITVEKDGFTSKTLEPITVTIAKATVTTPTAASNLQYTGKVQTGLEPGQDPLYKYVESSQLTGTNAGTYTATAQLNDSENYRWSTGDDNGDGKVQISWNIAKRRVIETSINSAYKGQTTPFTGDPIPAVSPPSSTPSGFFDVEYDDEGNLVGKIKGTDNVAFKISHAKETNAETYSVIASIEDFDNFCWIGHPNDPEVNLGVWTIGKMPINAPTITAGAATYTGEAYAGKVTLVHSDSSEGIIDLEKTKPNVRYYTQRTGGNGGDAPVNAGTYYAGVESDGWEFVEGKVETNYQIIGGSRAQFSISKATATMTFDRKEVTATYTAEGTALQPVTVTDLLGNDKGQEETVKGEVQYSYKYSQTPVKDWSAVSESMPISDSKNQKFTKVGYYQITAKWGAGTVSNNYTATDATYTLTIKKAEDQSITLTPDEEGRWTEAEGQTPAKYTITYGEAATFTVTGKAALDKENADISYAVNGDSNVVSVDSSSGVVTIHKAGTATITVTAADTDNVTGTSVNYTVTVNRAKPTVNTGLPDDELTVAYTGEAITDTEYNKATATAEVVAGADQPAGDITYTFYTNKDCTEKLDNGAEGNVPIAVGTYYMKATYPGDKNYLPAESKVVTVTVTKAQLTVDAEGHTGTYDGKTHDAITVNSVTGNSEEITGYTVKYAVTNNDTAPNENAGEEVWKGTLPVKDVADSTSENLYYWYMVTADNYNPAIGEVEVEITPAPLTVAGEPASYKKEYDGDNTVTDGLTGITVTAENVPDVTISVAATGTYADKNAGEEKDVTLTLSLSGTDGTEIKWGNYSYGGTALTEGKITLIKTDAGTITPKEITVTGISAENRVYDGTKVVQLAGTPGTTDFLADDSVNLKEISTEKGTVESADVETDKTVTVAAATLKGLLTGEDAKNYTVTQAYTTTVNITKRPVTLQFPNGNDGTTEMTAPYSPQGLIVAHSDVYKVSAKTADDSTGFVGEDALAENDIQYTFTQDEQTVEKPINVGKYTVNAALTSEAAEKWSNYTIKAITGTVEIIQATEELTVTVTGKTGLTYTGKGQDPIQSISVQGGSETLKEDEGYTVKFRLTDSGEYALDRNALTAAVKDAKEYTVYWQVTTTNYGNEIGNFTVTVDPATLTLSSSLTEEKKYNGTTVAAVTKGSVEGAQNSENITVSSVSAAYDNANVGTGKTITTTYKVTFGAGVTPGNYTYTGNVEGKATSTWTIKTTVSDGKITQAPVTVTISDQTSVYDGKEPTVGQEEGTEDEPKAWYVSTGEVFSQDTTKDNLGIALSIASGSKDAGTYAITGTANNSNYDVTFTGSWTGGTAGTYTITHRPISVQIGNAEGFYGDAPVLKGIELTYEGTDEENHRGLAPDENSVPNITLGTGASAQSPVAGYVIYAVDGSNGQIQKDTPVVIGNYNVTFTNEGTYTVKQRPITITIADQESDYGCEIAKLAYSETLSNTYTGSNKNVVFVGDDEDELGITLSTTAKKGSDAGTYPISGEAKAESSVVSNYAITWKGETPYQENEEQATYTVKKATLAVEFTNEEVTVSMGGTVNNPLKFINQSNSDEELGGQPQDVTVKYSSNDQGVATVNETTGEITLVGTGNATITAEVTSGGKNFTGGAKDSYIIHVAEDGGLLVTVTPKTLTYTGEMQNLISYSTAPAGAEVTFKVEAQTEGDRCQIASDDGLPQGQDAGTYRVSWVAKLQGYRDATGSTTVTIAKASPTTGFSKETVSVPYEENGTFDSTEETTLNVADDYKGTITYMSNDTRVASVQGNSLENISLNGTGSATITAVFTETDNYTAATASFRITVGTAETTISYTAEDYSVEYDRIAHGSKITVKSPSEYTIMYSDNNGTSYDLNESPTITDAGDLTIYFQIQADGYNSASGTQKVTVEPKEITANMVTGIAESYTYTGKEITFDDAISVHDEGVLLEKDKDYTITYDDNKEVGTGFVTITGMGNYTGEVIEHFDIIPVDGSSGMTASIDPAYGTYDPDGNTATVTVTHQTGSGSHDVDLTAANAKYTISATDLVTGQAITDHGATGTGNTLTFTKPAIYDITLKLTGDHRGEFHLSYTLLPLSNEDGGLTLTVDDETQKVFTYGDEIDPSDATIKVTANNTDVTDQCTLTYVYTPFEGTPTTTASPYTAEVLENAGVYTVTATPTDGSAITGTGTFTFLILQRDLSEANLTVEDSGLVYNQKAQMPSVTVAANGDPVQGTDYTITYYNNVNASDAAKAVVTATGNNFTGSKTAEFTIAPKPITDCVVENIPDQFYTGEPVIPPVTIKDGDYALILGYDYTTACEDKGPGEATVTITGTGNYTGEVEKTFTIQSEGAPEPSERFDLAVTPSQWTWGDDLTNLDLSVTFGTDKELTLGTEYTLSINNEVYGDAAGETKEQAIEAIKSLKPSEYTITATGVGAYNGSTDTETVTIQKIQPTVTVKATPNSLSGGGKVTLTLKGEKLPNGTDLKTRLSVTAKNDNDVTLEDLHIQWPEDGSLTAELTLPNTNETYTFALRFAGDEYYEPASSDAMVVVGQQTSGGGGGSDPGDQPADPDDTGVSDWLNTKDHLAYLAGYPGGTFGPDQNMTRAEAAQMFYNLLLEKDVKITVEFEDVPADAWYAKPVNTLASLGILSGVGNGRFDPERSITRAEFTVIAMKFANTSGGGVNIFSDVNEDDWFYSAVVDSTQYGWINGYPDGTFRPEATISRAEVTVIVNHMLGRAADRPYVIAHEEELNTFGDVNRGHWGYFHVAEATNAHEYHTEDGTESWTGLS